MDVDVDEEPSRPSPSKTLEERRVAMDAQRAVIQSYAMMKGKTARDAYDHLCKVSQSFTQILCNFYAILRIRPMDQRP